MTLRIETWCLAVTLSILTVPLSSFCASTADYSDLERVRHGDRPVKLDDKVPFLEITDRTLVEFIQGGGTRTAQGWIHRLSRGIVYYDWHAQREGQRDPKINLRLSSVTVRDVLNALTAADTNYYWIQDGDVVNFLPRRKTSPLDVVSKLEERIPFLEIQAPDMHGAWISLLRQAKLQGIQGLDPRIPASTAPFGSEMSSDYGPEARISLSLRNKSLREALNAMVAADPPAFWIAYPLINPEIVFIAELIHAHWDRATPASWRRPAAVTAPPRTEERKNNP